MVNKLGPVKAVYRSLVNCRIDKHITDQRDDKKQDQAQLSLVGMMVNFSQFSASARKSL